MSQFYRFSSNLIKSLNQVLKGFFPLVFFILIIISFVNTNKILALFDTHLVRETSGLGYFDDVLLSFPVADGREATAGCQI